MKRNITERAIKTFIETFFATIAMYIMTTDLTDANAVKALIISALATALSALINGIQNKGGEEDE